MPLQEESAHVAGATCSKGLHGDGAVSGIVLSQRLGQWTDIQALPIPWQTGMEDRAYRPDFTISLSSPKINFALSSRKPAVPRFEGRYSWFHVGSSKSLCFAYVLAGSARFY